MEYTTANNIVVKVDDDTQKHLTAHPDVVELLPEAFSKFILDIDSEFDKKEIKMERVVGKSGLVKINKIELDTPTYFAKRKERKFQSHVSLNTPNEDCDTVVISIHKIENEWCLVTAFIGHLAPNEPFYYFDKNSWFYNDEEKYKISMDFWMSHVFIYDENIMDKPYESTWRKEIDKIKTELG
jgi:hypothetical protein